MADITSGIVVTLVNVEFKGQHVDLQGANSTGNIQGYEGNGTAAQKWSFQSQGDGQYKVKSSISNTWVYLAGGLQPGEGLTGDVQATLFGINKISNHTVQITAGDHLAWTLDEKNTQIGVGEKNKSNVQFWTWAPA
ncbi:hypothetical protein FIBSPDRAFT_1037928 [Athelia psychrophila]|uniref:Ricin B lectin domain-containing protein n=1 Tax=Athelia psychrophila TaxID=1759441 RepID=A0A166TXG3_9AGAM|nr:hypothetical protein FIBSPDRAFT_1037928 [Fibularhizoctonia sp. CBS 109695]